ncbi:MAG: zinc-ribbon domain-containing protein [Planctomycetaceae bacterium]|jgi:hypothetical protein|nr:zinc-ribbon domain-containing protein [Planctomycetaceae bacterium]
MAITVVCPGCLKRFQVSDRFAGAKGPCPNCNTVITIPKAAVKIHGAEEFAQGGKTASGKLVLKPISRLDMDFDPVYAGFCILGVLAVYVLTWILGAVITSNATRDVLGGIGVFFLAFPLSLFGYQVLRDREQLFMLTDFDLYQKTAVCAVVYAVLWILFEIFIWLMNADLIFVWIYFAAFACMAMLTTHAVLDVNVGSSLLHYLIFFVAILILRGTLGLGWLWIAAETIRKSSAPPPPLLPGM